MLQENNNCVIDTEMRDIMGKSVYIAEKPSVAQEFAKALHVNFTRKDGYLEGGDHIVTWCVGHLVTMSYPDAYDPNLKRWSFDTLPFIPKEFKYEVIPAVAKQFNIVKDILTRDDVEYIYVCTDSGREGEYIYRLVRQEAGVKGKKERRVWIDSQTEEEILKGINTAKDISEYDNLSDSAYLRAKEDYLMGINFSRVLTLKYGRNIANYLHLDRAVVSVGRVMTCVLGMVVRREREIRSFVKTPFYRVIGQAQAENSTFDAEWRVSDKSMYAGTPYLYKDNGFKDREKAEEIKKISRKQGAFVHMKDVGFFYKDGRKVYEHAGLCANPGEIIALIGPSGQGKTTTLRMFLGLIQPRSGIMTVGNPGGDVLTVSPSTRCLFSYVPQGNTMFSGTIADNMRMVKPDASDCEIQEALEASHAWEFVRKLENGMNTKVGERGLGFSEGQNQRLSIARALLADAPIMLLDEATSALDVATERRVLRSIIKKAPQRTIIVTAHRPSVFSMCSRVYKIEDETVQEVDEEGIRRFLEEF